MLMRPRMMPALRHRCGRGSAIESATVCDGRRRVEAPAAVGAAVCDRATLSGCVFAPTMRATRPRSTGPKASATAIAATATGCGRGYDCARGRVHGHALGCGCGCGCATGSATATGCAASVPPVAAWSCVAGWPVLRPCCPRAACPSRPAWSGRTMRMSNRPERLERAERAGRIGRLRSARAQRSR